MRPTITGFMIGLTLLVMFVGIFGLFMSEFTVNYGTGGSNTLSKYNKTAEIYAHAQDIRNTTIDIDQPTSVLDIVGGFFYNSYQAMITSVKSIDLFIDLTEDASKDLSTAGQGIVLVKNAAITILLFVIFIGVVLSALIKSDVL